MAQSTTPAFEAISRARDLIAEGNPGEAFGICNDLANGGNAYAQVTLGWMYYYGRGAPQDKRVGLSWCERAAAFGSSEGAFYCGRIAFLEGRFQDGIKWFTRSSNQNYGPACYWLGLSHLRGYGVPVDTFKGIQYLRRGADTGNWFARRDLALQMIRGRCGLIKVPLGLVLLPYWMVIAVVEFLRTGPSERLFA